MHHASGKSAVGAHRRCSRGIVACRRAFQPLVDAGFVEIVYGGGDVGKFLCQHPTVASVHLTGSAATFDAIVWGDNKAKVGDLPSPLLTAPTTTH